MERLTERAAAGHGRIIGIKEESLAARLYKGEALKYFSAVERLAAYEDTGLTPEEIKALTADKDQQAKLLEEAREEIQNCYGRDTDLTSKIDALLGGAEDA